MKLNLEVEEFEKLQGLFIEQVVDKIKLKLQEAGLKDRELEEVTASLGLSIASMIDDTSGMESDGVEIRPYLTFRLDDDEIIHSGENSETYDYVMGALKKTFEG